MGGRIMKKLLLALLTVTAVPASLWAISAEDIVRNMEKNTVADTARTEGMLVVTDRFGTNKSTFISYSRGVDDMLIEFTSVDEEGMKILRTRDEIYLFYPDAEELIRMQGAALKESVMGSDMSYEDMTGGKSLLRSYSVALEGTETVAGEPCYRVSMTAKNRNVPYYSQTMWIDTGLFIYRQVHKFSRSGKLLKEITADDIRTVSGRVVPFHLVLKDTLKRNSSTEFIIREIALDVHLDPEIFSLEELTW
jgi:outer membrane lipoprotein-sorting protein